MASTVNPRSRSRWLLASTGALVVAVEIVAVVALTWSEKGDITTLSSTTTVAPTHSRAPTSSTFTAPKTSVASDALFLSDVTEVDPALMTYEKKSGNVALRSLLTNGSAFCAFLNRDKDIDTAMVSVALGARQVESQTHLPLTVTTFNAVDSVALLTLCPSLESVVPASDLTKVRQLGAALAEPSN
jgi:hypothetical protein